MAVPLVTWFSRHPDSLDRWQFTLCNTHVSFFYSFGKSTTCYTPAFLALLFSLMYPSPVQLSLCFSWPACYSSNKRLEMFELHQVLCGQNIVDLCHFPSCFWVFVATSGAVQLFYLFFDVLNKIFGWKFCHHKWEYSWPSCYHLCFQLHHCQCTNTTNINV